MSDLDSPGVEDLARGARPISRFAVCVLLVAVLLVGLWWSGLFAARLSVRGEAGEWDLAERTGRVELTVSNQAPTAVRLLAVTGADGVNVVAAALDGEPVGAAPEVDGPARARLLVELELVDCASVEGLDVTLRVRTAGGVTRQLRVPVPGPSHLPGC